MSLPANAYHAPLVRLANAMINREITRCVINIMEKLFRLFRRMHSMPPGTTNAKGDDKSGSDTEWTPLYVLLMSMSFRMSAQLSSWYDEYRGDDAGCKHRMRRHFMFCK